MQNYCTIQNGKSTVEEKYWSNKKQNAASLAGKSWGGYLNSGVFG